MYAFFVFDMFLKKYNVYFAVHVLCNIEIKTSLLRNTSLTNTRASKLYSINFLKASEGYYT